MTALAALLWVRKNWKLALSAAALLLMVGAYFYVGHLRQVARAQKVRLEAASRQAVVQTAVTKAVDQVATKSTAIEERSHVTIQRIQAAPGAETAVPPAVLAVWLDGLRDDPDKPKS